MTKMFSHVDDRDQPAMVDVSGKQVTKRTAIAMARVQSPQNGAVTEEMKPISPAPSA